MRQFDAEVAIVGGGPAGSVLAILLGRSGVRTLLLDRARFPRDKPCGEGLMPAGVEALDEIGVTLDRYPHLRGVTYRLPGSGSASGTFAGTHGGRGTRRLVLDEELFRLAGRSPNVDAHEGCTVSGVAAGSGKVVVKTASGEVSARIVVGADGLHSPLAHWMGWWRPPQGRPRFALTGHVDAPGHRLDRVTVTLLGDCEVYSAPIGPDELLVAVLGGRGVLRADDERVVDAYARRVAQAHPDVSFRAGGHVAGAGPFWVRPSTIAEGDVFLLGDAAGFLDPLTGEGISDGIVAARKLAEIIVSGEPDKAAAYRAWESRRWRRRLFVNRLALTLTGSAVLARRALKRLQRRPVTLNRLLEVNDGTRGLSSLSVRDWLALAGV